MSVTELGLEKYVSLTTFKKDGTPVSTPVWVVRDDGRLLVWSGAETWKVKRIRRDGHVRVAACSPMGKLHGEPVDATATILDDTAVVQGLIARKYWVLAPLVRAMTALVRRVRHKPEEPSVTIAISLS